MFWVGGGGGGIRMGRGANGVSNLLMKVMAGRDMNMRNRQTRARECKPLSYEQLKERRRQRWRSRGQEGHRLDRNDAETT